jgi:hypothetical protein
LLSFLETKVHSCTKDVIDGAIRVVHVGMVLEALVHVVVRPCANYGAFYTVTEVEMLIVGVVDVLTVYT